MLSDDEIIRRVTLMVSDESRYVLPRSDYLIDKITYELGISRKKALYVLQSIIEEL